MIISRNKNLNNLIKVFVCVCARLCPTLWDPMDCSPPGSSVHGILQARILEWAAISFSRGSPQPRDWSQVSRNAGIFFTVWATREAQWWWFQSTLYVVDFFLVGKGREACRIVLPGPRIEPRPWTVEAQSPNHWTARKSPAIFHKYI